MVSPFDPNKLYKEEEDNETNPAVIVTGKPE